MRKATNTSEYDRMLDDAACDQAEEGIRQGLEDSVHNRVRPVTEFFAEFEARHRITDALP